jgi:glyoxylase-like metal-dependent hydrolase (beta-lactamase superfamily II)
MSLVIALHGTMRLHILDCGLGLGFLIENQQGLYLIDCGSPRQESKVLAKMKELGRNDLKLIWISHAHYDHYGSAAALRERTGAPIGVHPADAEFLHRGLSPLGSPRGYGFIYPLLQPLARWILPLKPAAPDFTLEDGQTFEHFGLDATLLHTPGHTPGSSTVLLAEGTAFASDLLPSLALLGVLLMAANGLQVWLGLRPLRAIGQKLTAIGEGRLRRLGDDLPGEVLPLAREVDALLEARELAIRRAQGRAADLAHGLRTPIQVLLGDAASLQQRGDIASAQRIEEVALAMRRHVERELTRARRAAASVPAHCDIKTVASRVLAVLQRTPAGGRLQWVLDIPDGLCSRMDQDDLAEVLGNLAENAARHASGRVAIQARPGTEGIVVSVADDGPGIPDGRLQEALRRGGRLDERGDGAGLGLAIVQDIAESWGVAFAICNTAQGLRAELTLPVG